VDFVLDADDALLRRLYWRAWALVLPSVYRDCFGRAYVAPELMGLTLLEAMACGTPAVSSEVGALPEFVRHRETGYVFRSLAELRQRLRRLAADPDLVATLGAEARRVTIAEYGLESVGKKILHVYRALTSGGTEVAA
jgi:glycosyltransferase involved in cell wall biosynthesis